MKRLFIITLAAAVTLAASLGAFLFFSLWPYYSLIGRFAAGVVITGCVCLAALMVAFTFNKIGQWHANRKHAQLLSNVVVAGEIVAMVKADGSFIHLSAMHEAAKIVQSAPAVKELPAPTYDNSDTVIELYDHGHTLRTIAESTGMTYYQVQKITSAYEERKQAKRA